MGEIVQLAEAKYLAKYVENRTDARPRARKWRCWFRAFDVGGREKNFVFKEYEMNGKV